MTFTLSLLASSASEVDWSRPLMIGWIVIALGLSLIEICVTWAAYEFAPPDETEVVGKFREVELKI